MERRLSDGHDVPRQRDLLQRPAPAKGVVLEFRQGPRLQLYGPQCLAVDETPGPEVLDGAGDRDGEESTAAIKSALADEEEAGGESEGQKLIAVRESKGGDVL